MMKILSNTINICSKYKGSLFITIFCQFFVSLSELVGLGFLIPVVNVLVNNKIPEQFLNLVSNKTLFNFFNFENETDFFIFIILIFFILKFFLTIFSNYFKLNFIKNLNTSLATKLFSEYSSFKYENFLKKGSATIIRNINNEVPSFTGKVVNPLLNLFSDVLLMIFFISFLFYYDFNTTLILGIFLIIIISLVAGFSKKYLFFLGNKKIEFSNPKIQYVQELARGIQEIKIFNLENFFLNKFKFIEKKFNEALLKCDLIVSSPKYFIELFAITIILGILLHNSSDLNSDTLIKISIFVVALLKLMPASNRILISFQQLNFGKSSLNLILNEIKSLKKTQDKKKLLKFKTSIILKNINFKYQNTNNYIFKNLSLKIYHGDTVGILGDTGSGKSTLINIILGLISPHSGTIKIDDIIIKNNFNYLLADTTYIPQFPIILNDTIENNITLGKSNFQNMIKSSIRNSLLSKYINSLKKKQKTFLNDFGNNLSGGQKQRVAISRFFYFNNNFNIFDESTNALDAKTEEKVIKNLIKNKNKKTIIFISHNKKVFKNFDKIYEIRNKKLKRTK
jgi:ATP-binding cassette, subfamily B, bacterial PglK